MKNSEDPLASNSSAMRAAAEVRRRWDEVRHMREQVLARQEQVLQQTRADVQRHVERMRSARASIIAHHPPPTRKPAANVAPETGAVQLPPQHAHNGPRFDFDSRRIAWEERRREQAEKRRIEFEQRNEPYREIRRQLEEKRRIALAHHASSRTPPKV